MYMYVFDSFSGLAYLHNLDSKLYSVSWLQKVSMVTEHQLKTYVETLLLDKYRILSNIYKQQYLN